MPVINKLFDIEPKCGEIRNRFDNPMLRDSVFEWNTEKDEYHLLVSQSDLERLLMRRDPVFLSEIEFPYHDSAMIFPRKINRQEVEGIIRLKSLPYLIGREFSLLGVEGRFRINQQPLPGPERSECRLTVEKL